MSNVSFDKNDVIGDFFAMPSEAQEHLSGKPYQTIAWWKFKWRRNELSEKTQNSIMSLMGYSKIEIWSKSQQE